MNDKWKRLVTDDRTFRLRLTLAATVALFFAVTTCLFAPYEYLLSNYDEFFFSFRMVWWCFALLFAAAFVITLVPGLLLRGNLYNFYITALFAVTFALYIQGNFIPADYGELTGAEITWERYGSYSFINTALWGGMLVLPFLLLYFSKKIWYGCLRFVSIFIVLIQTVTVVSVIIMNPDSLHNSTSGHGFSVAGTNELSTRENTIFILLDECDVTYINELRMYDEHSTDFLDGFTFYPDTVGVYNLTYPSITQFFTGKMWYMNTPVDVYNSEAWQQDELFTGMKGRGYDVRILGSQKDFASPAEGLIDNAAIEDPKISSYPGLMRTMMQLVAFRYLPHGLKAGVWTSPDDLERFLEQGDIYHSIDDQLYWSLKENAITATRDIPAFRFLHLDAMHKPFELDENLNYISSAEATSHKQELATFKVLEEIIMQLKAAGVYDNSAIIIAADHGVREERYAELSQPHNPTLMIKPRNSTGPFTISFQPMWLMNMKSTLMDAAGLDGYDAFGYSMLRPEDCPEVVRYFYPVVTADSQNELVEYEITGEATYMNVWRKTGRTWHLGKEYFND